METTTTPTPLSIEGLLSEQVLEANLEMVFPAFLNLLLKLVLIIILQWIMV